MHLEMRHKRSLGVFQREMTHLIADCVISVTNIASVADTHAPEKRCLWEAEPR